MGLSCIIEWASRQTEETLRYCLQTKCEECPHRDKPNCTDEVYNEIIQIKKLNRKEDTQR